MVKNEIYRNFLGAGKGGGGGGGGGKAGILMTSLELEPQVLFALPQADVIAAL